MTSTLPGIGLEWTAYAGSDTFLRYTVDRREQRTVIDEHESFDIEDLAPRLLLPAADVISAVQGAIAMRVTIPWDNASEPGGGTGTPTFFDYREDASNFVQGRYDEANNRFQLRRCIGGVTSTLNVSRAITLNETVTLVWAWDATTLYLSVNGAAATSGSGGTGAAVDADWIDLGTEQGLQDANLTWLWVLTFAAVPTTAELALIGALADGLHDVPELSAIASALPLLLWSVDEVTGSKVVLDDWTTIAEITDVDRPAYRDYAVASGQVYEYSVRTWANVFGDVLYSDRQEPPVADSCTFDGVVIQDTLDSTRFAIVRGREWKVEPQQDVAYVAVSGRERWTAQYGELEAARISLTPVPHVLTDFEEWEQVRALFSRQRTSGTVYLIRPGHLPERYYAQIAGLDRTDPLVLWQAGMQFIEAHFDEAIE